MSFDIFQLLNHYDFIVLKDNFLFYQLFLLQTKDLLPLAYLSLSTYVLFCLYFYSPLEKIN